MTPPCAFRRGLFAAGALFALGGCAGVPLRTMAKLATLQPADLMVADPRVFAVALDVDARVQPGPGRTPVVDLALEPVEAGAFAAQKFALASEPYAVPQSELGLRAAKPGRHWLVYRLTPAAAADLEKAQAVMRGAREAKQRGRLTLAVRNDWIAELVPAARGTETSTWVRLARADGFFELWSGRIPANAGRTT